MNPTDLEDLVKKCQESFDENGVALAEIFHTLSKELVKQFVANVDIGMTKKELTRQCVYVALERVPFFDQKKGAKAFNYFTTVMLNYMREEYRHAKKLSEREKKYGELL
jgi:hypothetical protein